MSAFFLQICGDKHSQPWPLCKLLLEAKWLSSRLFLDYKIGSGGVWLFHVQLFLWLHLSQKCAYRFTYSKVSGMQLHCVMHSKLEKSRKFCLGWYVTPVLCFCLKALQGYKCSPDIYCLLWQTGNLKTVFRIAEIIMMFCVYACDFCSHFFFFFGRAENSRLLIQGTVKMYPWFLA